MIEVTMYTRRNCPLCDKAKAAIAASRADVSLVEVDIDEDRELHARYTDDVPVIVMNGRELFRHSVDPVAFKAAVEGRGERVPLAREECVPCRGGVPALAGEELRALERELGNGWRVVDGHHLEKEFEFPDFATALGFTNRIGAIAEQQGHHPDIHLAWGRVGVTIFTHAVDGLTRSDFILAAKIDAA